MLPYSTPASFGWQEFFFASKKATFSGSGLFFTFEKKNYNPYLLFE